MKDGRHTICGYTVVVENDCVMYGYKKDSNGYEQVTYPYRPYWEYSLGRRTCGNWYKCSGISVSAFRSACYRHNMRMV